MVKMPSTFVGSDRWQRFLNRPPLILNRAKAAPALQGKRILITGAGGSLGSALTLEIAQYSPQQLVLLEASERNLYELQLALKSRPAPIKHAALLGSVAEPALVEELFRKYKPQVVYHAAAFKHVPLMEQNPFAAIQNNALATDVLYRTALRHDAEQFILLSTDKAADPVSIMGASKRIAELILLAPHPSALRTKAVRLGNVLGSEGSIVPLFLQQIASGASVTVTHPDIRRYFLTPADAVTLLLHAAGEISEGVLVPDLGEPLKVAELAGYLLTLAGSAQSSSSIVFTQPRPGDKMCEALLSSRELYRDVAEDGLLLRAVTTPKLPAGLLQQVLPALQSACDERSLAALLAAVRRVAPEYQPSVLLQPCAEMA